MFGRGSLFGGGFFGGDPGRDPFQQAEAMMRAFFDDPFLGPPRVQQGQGPQAHPGGQQQAYVGGGQGRAIHIEGDNYPSAPPRPGFPQQHAWGAGGGWGPQAPTGEEAPTVPHRTTGPIIDELEDGSHHHMVDFGSSQPDTVEEPEEDEEGGGREPRPPPPVQAPFGGAPARSSGQGASFHRVTIRTGGRGGMSYSRTQTTRVGAGGVAESQEEVQDSRTGQSSVTHTRRLGNKGRTTHHSWDREGRLESQDVLHNLGQHEMPSFEQAWSQHSQQSPPGAGPGWPAGPAGPVGSGVTRLPGAAAAAEPSYGGGYGSQAGAAGARQGPVIVEYESEEEEGKDTPNLAQQQQQPAAFGGGHAQRPVSDAAAQPGPASGGGSTQQQSFAPQPPWSAPAGPGPGLSAASIGPDHEIQPMLRRQHSTHSAGGARAGAAPLARQRSGSSRPTPRGHAAAGRKRKRGSDPTAMDVDLPQQAQQGAESAAAGPAAAEPVAQLELQQEPRQRQPTAGHRAAGAARPAGWGGEGGSMHVPEREVENHGEAAHGHAEAGSEGYVAGASSEGE